MSQELLLHGASELPGAAGQVALQRLKDEEMVESITCSESLGTGKWKADVENDGKSMGKAGLLNGKSLGNGEHLGKIIENI